ncbi:hypothetical protein C2G38_2188717 [Gigaspora rosea]|uniref:Uncharacterized protein n=1 Tax=Gigaspora rosea TaxID=44941 RepID=A0A397V6F4_9GLOM|nr:hypothetical protein C2G38_2188717 [Gigaspora rosea]
MDSFTSSTFNSLQYTLINFETFQNYAKLLEIRGTSGQTDRQLNQLMEKSHGEKELKYKINITQNSVQVTSV